MTCRWFAPPRDPTRSAAAIPEQPYRRLFEAVADGLISGFETVWWSRPTGGGALYGFP
jgi:hypothetical protein